MPAPADAAAGAASSAGDGQPNGARGAGIQLRGLRKTGNTYYMNDLISMYSIVHTPSSVRR